MLSVKVQMEDDDRDGVIVTPSGRDNVVLENGAVERRLHRHLRRRAGQGADAPVTVDDGRCSTARLRCRAMCSSSTTTTTSTTPTANCGTRAQTVTITAPDDAVVEGFHTDYIRFTVSAPATSTGRCIRAAAAARAGVHRGRWRLRRCSACSPRSRRPSRPRTCCCRTGRSPAPWRSRSTAIVGRRNDRRRPAAVGINFNPRCQAAAALRGQRQHADLPDRQRRAEAAPASSGQVQYNEAGYDGSFVKDSVVDIYDEDTPMVIVQTVDDGTVDVIEGSAVDRHVHASACRRRPTPAVVKIKVDAVETRTTYGRTALLHGAGRRSANCDGTDARRSPSLDRTGTTPQTVTVLRDRRHASSTATTPRCSRPTCRPSTRSAAR